MLQVEHHRFQQFCFDTRLKRHLAAKPRNHTGLHHLSVTKNGLAIQLVIHITAIALGALKADGGQLLC